MYECHLAYVVNNAQTFQRFTDQVLRDFHFCYTYIDGILIASATPEERQHLCLKDWRNTESPSTQASVNLVLIHLISEVTNTNEATQQFNVEAIWQFSQPTTQYKLRELLGMIYFYHRFIPYCTGILRPLQSLLTATKLKTTLNWNDTTIKAFNDIKQTMTDASLLSYPKPDVPTNIITDASNTAVGAVLQQQIEDVWTPTAFFLMHS